MQKLYGKDGQLLPAATLEGPRITKAAFPAVDAVYRSRPGDTKQRLWYVLDNALVLPEYIVEFQYQLGPGSKLQPTTTSKGTAGSDGGGGGGALASVVPPVAMMSPEASQAMLEGLEMDLRPLARPLLPWLALRHEAGRALAAAAAASGPMGNRGGGGGRGSSSSIAGGGFGANWAQEEAEVEALLSAAPLPTPRTKLPVLSEQLLGSFLGPGRPLAALVSLNLHNCGLRRIEGLAGLRDSLRELVLTYNEISRVEGVSELTGLQRLDLGHNCLKKAEGIKGLAALVHLDLSSNQVRCCFQFLAKTAHAEAGLHAGTEPCLPRVCGCTFTSLAHTCACRSPSWRRCTP